MIEFRVDRADGLPAYRQLVRQVREALRLGWLVPGDRLPTVREVVATSGVNPNTVLKAYRELEFAGLVEARQGAGTFVTGTLDSAPPEELDRLRVSLREWVSGARAAGLDPEGIQALLSSTLAEADRAENRSGGDR